MPSFMISVFPNSLPDMKLNFITSLVPSQQRPQSDSHIESGFARFSDYYSEEEKNRTYSFGSVTTIHCFKLYFSIVPITLAFFRI